MVLCYTKASERCRIAWSFSIRPTECMIQFSLRYFPMSAFFWNRYCLSIKLLFIPYTCPVLMKLFYSKALFGVYRITDVHYYIFRNPASSFMLYDYKLCWWNCWKFGCGRLRQSQHQPSIWFQTFSEISLTWGRTLKFSKVSQAPVFHSEVCKIFCYHLGVIFCPFSSNWIQISQNPI